MHNIWLIAKREYTERIKTKGFLIATILIPLLMGGGLFGVATLAAKSKTTSHIAVLTSQLQLADDLKQELENGKDSKMTVDFCRRRLRMRCWTRRWRTRSWTDTW